MKWVKRVGLFLVLAFAVAGAWIYYLVRASLPDIDGDIELAGLSAPVSVERDANGVATLRAEDRLDSSRALGFVHAQERFFQMDLMRRRAAGELAELVGAGALPLDRRHRVHRMRARTERSVAGLSAPERARLDAYTEGVNAGRAALGASPFEYLLLRQEPRPWVVADSVLVVASMFFELNDAEGHYESTLGLIHDVLPPELAEFLSPIGTDWDAPVEGEVMATPPVPGPGVVFAERVSMSDARVQTLSSGTLGSNNWAVAGTRTTHGGALLANDMHLGHAVPNIWYPRGVEHGREHRRRHHAAGHTFSHCR